jgi:hypothetical protein
VTNFKCGGNRARKNDSEGLTNGKAHACRGATCTDIWGNNGSLMASLMLGTGRDCDTCHAVHWDGRPVSYQGAETEEWQ